MKTMTCRDPGGPCDLAHRAERAERAERADDMIKAQDQHLRERVADGDRSHESALAEMKRRWRRPISGMGWYRATKREFAARPED